MLPPSKPEIYLSGDVLTTGGENCYNVLITAQGEGIITDGRFTLNRVYEMGANAARLFYTKYASFTGVVTDVWQGKAE